jgi:hypothetical protein
MALENLSHSSKNRQSGSSKRDLCALVSRICRQYTGFYEKLPMEILAGEHCGSNGRMTKEGRLSPGGLTFAL